MSSVNAKKRILDLLSGSYASTGYYGFSDIYADTDGLAQNIWSAPTYSDANRTAIMAALTAKPVTLLNEYPRTVAQLPAVFVYRIGDGESRGFVGDYSDEDEDGSTWQYESHEYGADLQETIGLSLWTSSNGPGQRDDLFLALRELLIRGRGYLHAAGLLVAEYKSGADGQHYRPEEQPHIVHTADIQISLINPLRWTERENRMLSINGNLQGYNQGRVTVIPYRSEK